MKTEMQLAVATSEISSAQVVEAAAKAAPHKVFKHHRHAKREESKAHEEKKAGEKVIPWTETTPAPGTKPSKDQLQKAKLPEKNTENSAIMKDSNCSGRDGCW